jgi:hypothetical protein
MSVHNLLRATVSCPRSGEVAEMEVELFFGEGGLIESRLGDHVQWQPRKSVKNGGRPDGGDLDGEGYAVCPICGLDFFLKVLVRADVITGLEPNREKAPHIKSSP